MKKFWKKTEGFTLVELIVVIAILGILAGVGTVGYSGYIKKANMAADQQLISEVKNAMILYAFSNPDAANGYVILKQEGEVNDDYDAIGDSAMTAAFGDGWKNSVFLKYSGWSSDGVLDAVLNLTDAERTAINNSNFFKKTSSGALMQTVGNLTNESMDFLGDRTAANIYNRFNTYAPDFVQYCKDSGLEMNAEGTAFKDADEAQLTNLMALYAADNMGKLTFENYGSAMQAMFAPGYGAGTMPEAPGMDTVTLLAAQYMILQTVAANDPNGAQKMAGVDAAIASATNLNGMFNALGTYFGGSDGIMDATESNAAMNSIDPNVLATDVNAVAAMMKAASNASNGFYNDLDDLKDGSLFASAAVGNALDTVKSVSAMDSDALSALEDVGDGEVLVMLMPDKTAAVNPSRANPEG